MSKRTVSPAADPSIQNASSARDALFAQHQEFVEHILYSVARSMRLPEQSLEDLRSAGYLGLIEAAERFRIDSRADFKSFAFLRIRGAMIDAIQDMTSLTRWHHRRLQALSLQQNSEVEGAEEENSPDEALASILEGAATAAISYQFEEEHGEEEQQTDPTLSAEEQLIQYQQRKLFKKCLGNLNEDERILIEEVYFEDKPLSHVRIRGELLSRSWASRLHSKAMSKIKEMASQGAFHE